MVRGTSLKILGLVSSDSGIYQCIATNEAGSVQAAAQLRVQSKGEHSLHPLQVRKAKYLHGRKMQPAHKIQIGYFLTFSSCLVQQPTQYDWRSKALFKLSSS